VFLTKAKKTHTRQLGFLLIGVAIFCAWACGTSGYDKAVADNSKGTVIVTLGTAGGPRPRPDRAQSANLLIVNGVPYLIDAGENVVRRLTQSGVDFLSVNQLFITHGHSDHTLGLPALLATQWEFQRREPLEIFGPLGTQKLVADALTFLSTNTDIRLTEGAATSSIETVVVAHDAPPGVIYQDSNITVTAIENTHFNFPQGTPAYGRFKSYSYRFTTSDRVVVFTGDTGPSPELVDLARGADVLVSEINSVDGLLALYKKNGTWQAKTPEEQGAWLRHQKEEHLSPEAVGKMATDAQIKRVVLTHLTPIAGGDAAYEQVAAQVTAFYSGEVLIAKDLGRF
jgi:ribonuclease BN (tRNA processing enzyme)